MAVAWKRAGSSRSLGMAAPPHRARHAGPTGRRREGQGVTRGMGASGLTRPQTAQRLLPRSQVIEIRASHPDVGKTLPFHQLPPTAQALQEWPLQPAPTSPVPPHTEPREQQLSPCSAATSGWSMLAVFWVLFFFFFKATPAAYASPQAGGQIGAAAAGLHHSHSNMGSEPHL